MRMIDRCPWCESKVSQPEQPTDGQPEYESGEDNPEVTPAAPATKPPVDRPDNGDEDDQEPEPD